ncbi:hypothetical protein LCGC14_2182070, partial [marine sediment metagenome]
MTYNSFPLGQVPEHLQRPELRQLKEMGYKFNDPREVIDIFEKKVAAFAGSKFAVAVDCCSHGLFLCLKYRRITGSVVIPRHTYISVPMQILHAGAHPSYRTIEWSGIYQLGETGIFDGAVRWTKDMYLGTGALQVVSFQYKKIIPIGRGGAILTDNRNARESLKLMSYDGRDLKVPYDKPWHIRCMG